MIEEIKIFKNIIISSDQQDYLFIIDELIKSGKKLFNYKLEINQGEILNESTNNRERQAMFDNNSLYDEFANNIKIINRLCIKNNTKVVFDGDLNNRENVDKFLLNLILEIFNNGE